MSETHLEIITRQLAEARGEADYWRNRAAKLFARNAKLEAEKGRLIEAGNLLYEACFYHNDTDAGDEAWQEAKSEPRVVLEREGETVRFYPEIDEEEPDGSS